MRVPPCIPGAYLPLMEHSSQNEAGAQRPGRGCVKAGFGPASSQLAPALDPIPGARLSDWEAR